MLFIFRDWLPAWACLFNFLFWTELADPCKLQAGSCRHPTPPKSQQPGSLESVECRWSAAMLDLEDAHGFCICICTHGRCNYTVNQTCIQVGCCSTNVYLYIVLVFTKFFGSLDSVLTLLCNEQSTQASFSSTTTTATTRTQTPVFEIQVLQYGRTPTMHRTACKPKNTGAARSLGLPGPSHAESSASGGAEFFPWAGPLHHRPKKSSSAKTSTLEVWNKTK